MSLNGFFNGSSTPPQKAASTRRDSSSPKSYLETISTIAANGSLIAAVKNNYEAGSPEYKRLEERIARTKAVLGKHQSSVEAITSGLPDELPQGPFPSCG